MCFVLFERRQTRPSLHGAQKVSCSTSPANAISTTTMLIARTQADMATSSERFALVFVLFVGRFLTVFDARTHTQVSWQALLQNNGTGTCQFTASAKLVGLNCPLISTISQPGYQICPTTQYATADNEYLLSPFVLLVTMCFVCSCQLGPITNWTSILNWPTTSALFSETTWGAAVSQPMYAQRPDAPVVCNCGSSKLVGSTCQAPGTPKGLLCGLL